MRYAHTRANRQRQYEQFLNGQQTRDDGAFLRDAPKMIAAINEKIPAVQMAVRTNPAVSEAARSENWPRTLDRLIDALRQATMEASSAGGDDHSRRLRTQGHISAALDLLNSWGRDSGVWFEMRGERDDRYYGQAVINRAYYIWIGSPAERRTS